MASKQRKVNAKVRSKAPAKKTVTRKVAAPRAPKVAANALEFPVLAHILKAGDRIPVTLTDQSHLDRLLGEHGAGSVEVQS